MVLMLLKQFILLLSLSLIACSSAKNLQNNPLPPAPEEGKQSDPQDMTKIFTQWKEHYQLHEPYSKMTNNKGEGYEDLYGTRNFRVVLHGVYYRGGANNVYHRTHPRDNSNPLPDDGLQNLCEEGFAQAIYFYAKNFSTAPQLVECGNKTQHLKTKYMQVTATDSTKHELLLATIYQRIKGQISGPIYGHCWNGWHASGLIAAIALQQFCDWSADEAANYWKRNTDGNSAGYEKVLKQVVSFKKIAKFNISAAEKAAICPAK